MSTARRFAIACGAIAFTAACAGGGTANNAGPTGPGSSGATAHADAGPPSRFGTVPLRLVHAADAGAGPAVELRSDGTIVAGTEVIARLVHEGTTLPNGAPLVSVAPDGAISIRGQRTSLRMEANGDVNSTGGNTAGASFTIDADGTPAERHAGGNVERSWGRFEHIPEGARPTAAVIYLTVLAERPNALPGAPDAPSSAPTQPPAAPSPPPAPTEPALALGDDLAPHVTGMPAIAPDGATVAVADVAHDGLRGAPNLTVRLFDARTGAARQAIAVLSVREGASNPTGPAAEALHRSANERLTRAQTAVHGFHPLTAMTFTTPTDGTAPVEASAGALRLTFTPQSRELVARDAAGAQRFRQVLAPARATGARRRPECTENPPLVREAWTDEGNSVLVFYQEYSGTDSCVAPDGTYHVVRLSGAAPASSTAPPGAAAGATNSGPSATPPAGSSAASHGGTHSAPAPAHPAPAHGSAPAHPAPAPH